MQRNYLYLTTLNVRLVFFIGYCTILVMKFIVIFFLLGDSPASEFYVPTFWKTYAYATYEDGTECSETWAYKI
jgi:hypothetical protein